MTRFLCMLFSLTLVATCFGATFSDLPKTHWAYDAVEQAVEAGLIDGIDGKYMGNQKLNRFHVAVITKKMLDKFKSGDVDIPASAHEKVLTNLQALVIEFGEELQRLNVKLADIEEQISLMKPQEHQMPMDDSGFRAYAAFALVNSDTDNGGASRYSALGRGVDSTFFDMQQVSLAIDKQVSAGVHFYGQFDFASDLNNVTGVGVNQAYFFADELFGQIGGKVGAFAPPFSLEHNGPFRTLNLTITPSIVNSYHDSFRFTGLELQQAKNNCPDEISWRFGIVSGTDGVGAPAFLMSDFPVNVNRQEADDGIGFYIWIGRRPQRNGDWGWNFSYFDNGGDNNPGAVYTASPGGETDFFQLGFEWSKNDFLVMAQYLDGTSDTGADLDFMAYYLLVNYRIDEKQSVTLRWDEIEWDNGADVVANGLTFAFNRQVTSNSIMQFEYCTPDSGDLAANDVDDDLIQLRYKVYF